MPGVQKKSFEKPSETRKFKFGRAELVTFGDTTVGRFTFRPGWKWSKSVKPIVKTDSCQSHHLGIVASGRMKVVPNGGRAVELGAGDAYEILPGHDAWVVGKETFVGFEVKSAGTYAKPAT